MTIYQRIKELARLKGVSIRELEKQLGFSNGAINKWDVKAPSDKLEKVANYFNVSTDYLLGRDASPSKDKDKGANVVDLSKDDVILTYEGKPIPPEDLKLIQRLMNSTRNDL